MATETHLLSDIAIPPGELLAEELSARGMTRQELARQLGQSIRLVNRIVAGEKPITSEVALALEKVLGIPAGLWLGLEADYQLAKTRLGEREKPNHSHSKMANGPGVTAQTPAA